MALDRERLRTYLLNLDRDILEDSIGFYTSEHLRMGGAYWTIGSLSALQRLDDSRKEEIVNWVLSCQKENGGFGGNVNHDVHINNTHYAVLILMMYGALDRLDKDRVVAYVQTLQHPDGSFSSDEWGESDLRFTYSALAVLKLLNRVDLSQL